MFSLGEISLASLPSMLIGGLIGHFLAKDRSRQERSIARFNAATVALRSAFAEDIAFLRGMTQTEPGNTYDRLKASFPSHEKTVFQFREVLSDQNQSAFDAAWREYFFPEGVNLIVPREETHEYIFGQYIGISHEDEKEKRILALASIEKLLNLAVEK